MDGSRIESNTSSLWKSVPCGKSYGIHKHAQIGDLFHMSELLISTTVGVTLLKLLDNLELSFMKLSSFQSFARLDWLNLKAPFSSSSTLSCLITSSISSLNGCVYSGLAAKSKTMKTRAFVVVLIEAKDTVNKE